MSQRAISMKLNFEAALSREVARNFAILFSLDLDVKICFVYKGGGGWGNMRFSDTIESP